MLLLPPTFFFSYESGSFYEAQADFELGIVSSLAFQVLGYKCGPPHSVKIIIF